jgi:hypothetical protein
MNADWTSWVDFAKARREAKDANTTILLALVQRGASAGEAEAVVRSLGGGFQLSNDDAAELAAQKRRARFSVVLGLVLLAAGIALLVLLGPAVFLGGRAAFLGGWGPILSGALIAFGLFKVGTNVGTL